MHVGIEDFAMPEADRVEAAVSQMRLLADPTRLRILCALDQGESDVGCLAELAGTGPPAVSQHLAKLRLAGVVKARREGQRMVYELLDPGVRALLAHLLSDADPSEVRS
jgi:DNA-binding transcriptional ArsR family regulator